jgi:DNA-binding NarL/FixJ family response regulator
VSLTRRERDVAELLARGHTDRQIADALYISAGTVGVHVHHILGKLGLHSRVQVADWLAGQAPASDGIA